MSDDAAWAMLMKADKEKNLDDFKIALKAYGKALLANGQPFELAVLDQAMRDDNMNVHIVAIDKKEKAGDVFTIVDFNGKTGCTYGLSFNFSYKPKRKMAMSGWPKTPEENRERLADAGFVLDRFVTKCLNCGGKSPLSSAHSGLLLTRFQRLATPRRPAPKRPRSPPAVPRSSASFATNSVTVRVTALRSALTLTLAATASSAATTRVTARSRLRLRTLSAGSASRVSPADPVFSVYLY
ncbi:hypothetical protein HDK77DRAFT_253210 [Phyllosticta capitalensis]